ncbi:unnamed protein product [Effrenium voratum]|uniref:Uncharacterized protein n=1 Tax=Effrenium voratum TaxID=2562239 RepID=A0AA36NB51_9DINO|nr:unnamed protein product [Effrenium voratum]
MEDMRGVPLVELFWIKEYVSRHPVKPPNHVHSVLPELRNIYSTRSRAESQRCYDRAKARRRHALWTFLNARSLAAFQRSRVFWAKSRHLRLKRYISRLKRADRNHALKRRKGQKRRARCLEPWSQRRGPQRDLCTPPCRLGWASFLASETNNELTMLDALWISGKGFQF